MAQEGAQTLQINHRNFSHLCHRRLCRADLPCFCPSSSQPGTPAASGTAPGSGMQELSVVEQR